MSSNAMHTIEQIESSLWEAADQLRANSKLTSSEYCMPVLGVIFLRHASNRYEVALAQIKAEQQAGKMPNRPLVKSDFIKRRALMMPEIARYDYLLKLPSGTSLGTALVEAMNAIEADFEPLNGQLPKDYDRFENDLLEHLLRTFDSAALRTASGDIFGRIYEYFLMKFAMQGAQDNGEFFTPPSLVQTIVNVIEPDHGIVFDPACGSGGMFVQSSHFIESHGEDTSHKLTFYGQEKTATTIRLAKMNLAVHGLEGDIREANTFYQDEHPIWGKCDFVMANPPFNVDMVDARNIYRKVTRKIYDFSPEQLANLTAIVWLYRGEQQRFIELVEQHIDSSLGAAQGCFLDADAEPTSAPLGEFTKNYRALRNLLSPFLDRHDESGRHNETLGEFFNSENDPIGPIEALRLVTDAAQKDWNQSAEGMTGAVDFHHNILKNLAEQSKALIVTIDHAFKITTRTLDLCEKELGAKDHPLWNSREINKARKAAETSRHEAVEHLKQVRYFKKQAGWLIERFPEAVMVAVPGLCKVVSRAEIEAADWSLTPGRYVGVAPAEVDDDFDFEQTMRDIHVELADLNREAMELGARIQENFEGLEV